MTSMSKAQKTTSARSKPRQIVGFSLDPATARDVKAHAAKHGVSLKKLFEEMWQAYKKQVSGAQS
jgi:hypothetical protein